MEIKNFLEGKLSEDHNCHDGVGMFLNNGLFKSEEFKSNIQFINYTILPAGSSIGNHVHGNDEEIYIILSGIGEMYLDGATYPVRAGSITVNKPFNEHGLNNTGYDIMTLLVLEVKIGS